MRETEFSVSGGKVNATGDRGLTPACFGTRGNLSSESVAIVTESVT